jgi:hypothetical protein
VGVEPSHTSEKKAWSSINHSILSGLNHQGCIVTNRVRKGFAVYQSLQNTVKFFLMSFYHYTGLHISN